MLISVTAKQERETYHRWVTADRFEIMENANTAAVRKIKTEFPHLNESTVREFKKNIISRSRTL